MDDLLVSIKKYIPESIFNFCAPIYHVSLAYIGALIYGFPSRKIRVIAVTGTKGKSSTTEIINAMFESDGHVTALSNTIRFKIAGTSRPNLYKMSMPGRFFMQKFLADAVKAGCDTAIIEATSQGALLSRHRFIDFDALLFTNLAPEHIEAHGSYENYVAAKVSIGKALERSKKKRKVLVVNGDDKESGKFLALDIAEKKVFCLYDANPWKVTESGIDFTFLTVKMHSPLTGVFNLMNILGAATLSEAFDVRMDAIKKTIETFSYIPGRVEYIHEGQDFEVVVDYAHTPDSLRALYGAFEHKKKICVLGNTGGGRDTWKRDEMAKIAEKECDEIILTNEDPYDDNPEKIVRDMAEAIPDAHPHIIMDRHEAIAKAISLAKENDAVLITGKGTDPYIMGPRGTKIPWSDAEVAREELQKAKKINTVDLVTHEV